MLIRHRIARKRASTLRKTGRPLKFKTSFNYRGFTINLWNNGCYSHRYEYSIDVPAQKRILANGQSVVSDPTSHRLLSYAAYYAKMNVNELCSPFWLHPWH